MALTQRKLEWQREWRRTHPEQVRAYAEARKAQRRRHWALHAAEIKLKRAPYFAAQRQKARERARIWKRNNPERVRTINANRRARKACAIGFHTVEQWETLKTQHHHTCLGCGRREPEIKLTRDHIIPLTRGGSNLIENIQPLCKSCNSSKNNRLPAVILLPSSSKITGDIIHQV